MQISFPEQFQQELADKLNIDPEDVLDAIREYDDIASREVDDLTLRFYKKYVPQMPAPYYLLAYGQHHADTLEVNMAWKIYPSLDERIAELKPIQLLEQFAERFGLPIALGEVQRRFFLNEAVRIPRENWREGITLDNPENHEYVQQIFTKAEEHNGKIHLTCALGLCIDIDRYRTWMANE